ncbi:MAG TPA: branched-chain amino acid ABC transporter permease [Candidatus Sulfotelmatobacter sp.]|nr:branched-chain amino acid ABC transporter permease [Candidatus Sulfotelmatobacter sp.]
MLAVVLQLLVNGVVAGSLLAVPAIGLTTIYAVLRFPNFAVASLATIGAFAGYVANTGFGWPAAAALPFAAFVAGLIGVASDEIALKPMRPHGALPTAIASIVLTVILENVVRFGFGNAQRGYRTAIFRDWRIDGIRIGPQQLENLGLAVLCVALLFLFLALTRTGKAMRAVADNPTLADVKGINAAAISRLATFIGMGLAGAGGMLLGLDTSIDPLTGFRAILPIFAAAVVGGLGSIPGAVVGALAVGIGEELSLLALPPTYRTAVGFLAILLVLTVRPRGIFGQRAY